MSRSENLLKTFTSLFMLAAAFMLFFSNLTYGANSNVEELYLSSQQNVLTMMNSKETAVYGNEWLALDLIRDSQEVPVDYINNLVNTIVEKKGVLHTGPGDYTNYSKAVLVLSAYGIDPTDVSGYDLTKPLSDFPQVQLQGINGVIYALIALDCHSYDLNPPNDVSMTVSRDTYINAILDSQLSDGGWDWADKAADPDMTAMAIQALAPYYNSNEKVKVSIDTALQTLSAIQQPDGGFNTEDAAYEESSESASMVIIALTALGIDPTNDSRFIKNGYSPIDNLCSFSVPEGGFSHIKDGGYNELATDQGYRALVSYNRLLKGKTSLYDMTDVKELHVIDKTDLIPNETSSVNRNHGYSGMLWYILAGVAILIIIGIIIAVKHFKKGER